MSQSSPYQSPFSDTNSTSAKPPVKLTPASLRRRLLAAIVDFLAALLLVIPAFILVILSITSSSDGEFNPVLLFLAIGWVIFASIGLTILNLYLLYARSQTIGKLALKIQIVNYEDGAPADLIRTFVMRGIVNSVIGSIPIIGMIYSLVDILYIFTDEHRCIHDLIAKTIVVDYKG